MQGGRGGYPREMTGRTVGREKEENVEIWRGLICGGGIKGIGTEHVPEERKEKYKKGVFVELRL